MILYNAIKCDGCREVIVSTHTHDFKWCRCPEDSYFRCAVDGGYEYLKRLGNGQWDELSVVVDDTELKEELKQIYKRLPENGRYLDIEQGWWQLVINCHKELNQIDPDYRPIQIKQKFGGLRYYIDTDKGPEVLYLLEDTINRYEKLASTTCEMTGKTGATLYDWNGWLTTRHPDHAPDGAKRAKQTPQ